MRADQKIRVLFVCLGNACRSPMAEAIARHNASDILEPSSAGLFPLGYVPEMTEQTLLRNGYPAAGLSSKPLSSEVLDRVDLIINLSGEPRKEAFDNPSKVEDWSVADPYGANEAVYQRILEELEQRVRRLADRLREKRKMETHR
jgi:protein-tyrosine-phosphatase